jgi:hypothetical protein
MAATLKSLILRARSEHHCGPGASAEEVALAENLIGYRFTEDLRELLRECNGIQFWATGKFPCRLLPVSEIKPVHRFLEVDEGPPGVSRARRVAGRVCRAGS